MRQGGQGSNALVFLSITQSTMKLATQLAIDELRSLHHEDPIARVMRQKKVLAEWLENEYLPIERSNMINAMKAVYNKSLEDKRFDIYEFMAEYLEE